MSSPVALASCRRHWPQTRFGTALDGSIRWHDGPSFAAVRRHIIETALDIGDSEPFDKSVSMLGWRDFPITGQPDRVVRLSRTVSTGPFLAAFDDQPTPTGLTLPMTPYSTTYDMDLTAVDPVVASLWGQEWDSTPPGGMHSLIGCPYAVLADWLDRTRPRIAALVSAL